MKRRVQALLQRALGFERYLFVFACFKIFALRWEGARKEGDFRHFLRMLPREGAVLDIGANVGIMTCWLARQLRQGQVYAVEPVPENLQALRRVVRFFGLSNVRVFPYALGAEAGSAEILMPVLNGARMQGLSHVRHESIEGFGGGSSYAVRLIRLDDLELPLPLAGIKLDVENFEYFVLQGGKRRINQDKPLIYCELWDNENRSRCLELVRGWGYQVAVLEGGSLRPFEPARHRQQNFFFLPPEKPAS
jgi:FkbM family methyltransferase